MKESTQKLCGEIEKHMNSLPENEIIERANLLLDMALMEIVSSNFLGKLDKGRLDWLADTNNSIGNVTLPTDCVEQGLEGGLREMIDLAMEKYLLSEVSKLKPEEK